MQRPVDADADYEDDDIPLHHKRPFGSGLKRKRVEFVRAQQPDDASGTFPPQKPAVPAGDIYASIVLGRGEGPRASSAPASTSTTATTDTAPRPRTCPVCGLAVPAATTAREHEASLAHQVSVAHSHPPSAVDRTRMGLRALAAQGWDPDARRGLGREGSGVRFPVKVAAKDDTLGVGATVPAEGAARPEEAHKEKKLDAREMRAAAERQRRRGERLQGEIFGRVDVERYLRGEGGPDG